MEDRNSDAGKGRMDADRGKEIEAGISPRQEVAVRELVRGEELAGVARRVGVSRMTLYRWMQDPLFVAAMNRWRRSAREAARAQLVAALGDAARTVAKAVREGDVKVAVHLLDKMRVAELTEEAEGDAETVIRRTELERRADRVALDRIENSLDEAEEMNAAIRRLHKPSAPEGGAADGPAVWNPFAAEKDEKGGDEGMDSSSAKAPVSAAEPTAEGKVESTAVSASEPQPAAVNPAATPAAGSTKPGESENGAAPKGAETGDRPADASAQPREPSAAAAPPAPAAPAVPPAPAAQSVPVRRRISRPTGHAGMRGPYGAPYSPGAPEPIDELEDQFIDIFHLDR